MDNSITSNNEVPSHNSFDSSNQSSMFHEKTKSFFAITPPPNTNTSNTNSNNTEYDAARFQESLSYVLQCVHKEHELSQELAQSMHQSQQR